MPYSPLTSALILINTASVARGDTALTTGSVEEVSKKLRGAADEHVDLIHWLLGPNDMIVHVHASELAELLNVIDSKIMPLKNERHDYIASTETLLVANSRVKGALSGLDTRPTDVNAWVFANTNTNDPEFGFMLMEEKNVIYMAHVIGRYDMVLLIRADTLPELMSAVDKTIRTKNFFSNTDTRIVLM